MELKEEEQEEILNTVLLCDILKNNKINVENKIPAFNKPSDQ